MKHWKQGPEGREEEENLDVERRVPTIEEEEPMKHWKQGPDGREVEERVDVEPRVPSIEELDPKHHGLAGPNEFVSTYMDTHETVAERSKRAPSEGYFTVEVDEHFPNLRLPDHPRDAGWIEADPSKPLFPEKKQP